MADETRSKIVFHPDAVGRLDELASEILNNVTSFGPLASPSPIRSEIHPVVQIPSSDIINLEVTQFGVNRMGEEIGRYWNSNGMRVGWEGEKFEQIKSLAHRFEMASPIKDTISEKFLVDAVFKWLRETLERKRSDVLSDYLAGRCADALEKNDIWIPVCRTHSAQDFALGDVEFRTVSKEMMEEWFRKLYPQGIHGPAAEYTVNRERSQIQGRIAVRIKLKAERQKAREVAHAAATEAVGLLRFLSHANWTSKIVSYAVPLGSEHTFQAVELFVKDGAITTSNKSVIEKGPPEWSVDEARAFSPGVLESLQELASNPKRTAFRSDLYEALQLHSRSSIAAAVSHKIVFVIAAIESLLLKNSTEPIQKNLGERMAFIIGNSLEERKEVVANVEEFYRIRSRLIHHGREAAPHDVEVIDKFFFNVWWTFRCLLDQVDRFKSREELLAYLEDKKLS